MSALKLASCGTALGIAIASISAVCGNPAIAQITSDGTLPINSNINQEGDTLNITGGTLAGSNLFHSFKEFSVPNNNTAFFNNPDNIQNIFSRVTGSSVSNIDGIIKANGTANLFLINPNGIIFGRNASLNIGGSFVATTANAIRFGNQGLFSASAPNNPELLEVNPSAFLFNQITTGLIQNNSANLSVEANRSLLLLGGNVNINGGVLNAFGGQVELGGLAVEGTVDLNISDNYLSLNFPSNLVFADVLLRDGAEVNVASGGGGSITINAQNIDLVEGSSLRAGISPLSGTNDAQAGDITLSATGTVRVENSFIYNTVFDQGNGGDVRIDAENLIIKDGAVATATISGGRAGNLIINAKDLVELSSSASSNGNSFINIPINVLGFYFNIPANIGLFSTSIDARNLTNVYLYPFLDSLLPVASGNTGNLSVTTGRLSISNGAVLLTGSTTGGNTGNLIVKTDNTELNNSAIYNAVFGSGNGGDLLVNTKKLTVRDGVVATATISQGKAGNLFVNADNSVELTGSSSSNSTVSIYIPGNIFGYSNNFNVPIGLLSASVNAQSLVDFNIPSSTIIPIAGGDAGNLNIETGQLIVRGGAIVTAGTTTTGKSGNLTVTAKDFIEVSGTSANEGPVGLFTVAGRVPSGLRNGTSGLGLGGDLTIETARLFVNDGAWVTTGTEGQISGGELIINASELVEVRGTAAANNLPSVLASGTQGGGDGKNLTINTRNLRVSNGGIITGGTYGSGRGGDLTINASESVELSGTSQQGVSGNVLQQLGLVQTSIFGILEDRPFPSGVISGTADQGNAGDLNINTGRLLIQGGAQASVSTVGAGNAGSLNVKADTIELTGTGQERTDIKDIVGESLLSTAVGEGANGKGGDITVQTSSLTITDSAGLTASTDGQGNAGNIFVQKANLVSLSSDSFISTAVNEQGVGSGGSIDITTDSLFIDRGAQIIASTQGEGNAGSIFVTANTVEAMNGGQFRTSTSTGKNAGNIIFNVSDRISLTGKDSGLFASTEPASTGNGGNIFIDPRIVTIEDAAKISVDSQGSGTGGSIEIQAGTLSLNKYGVISAETASNQGGNIRLELNDFLLLRNGSEISTSAGTAQQPGDGGNITINIPNGFIVAVPDEDSNISANAYTGKGGRVEIEAYSIYGIQSRQNPTALSDITASSEFGVNGTIELNTADVEPNRGLVELPAIPVDTQIAQSCYSPNYVRSKFVITGRGGLPLNPREAFSNESVQAEWATLNPSNGNQRQTVTKNTTIVTSAPVVEATGWMTNAKGEIVLTANAPTVSPHSSWETSITCGAPTSASKS